MLLVAAGPGCSGKRYTYRTLPKEYLAAPAENIEEIGLTKLHVPPVNSQLIDIGDVLEVTITTNSGGMYSGGSGGSANLPLRTTPVRVFEDGTAHIPTIGRVHLAGFEVNQAEQVIAAAGRERQVYVNPYVMVKRDKPYTNRIWVIGAVEDPGVQEVTRSESSLLGVLVAAGDLTDDAGPEVIIRRAALPGSPPNPLQLPPLPPPDQRMAAGAGVEQTAHQQPLQPTIDNGVEIIRVNLMDAAATGNSGGPLRDGDVVIVPKRAPKQIYVLGLVRNPKEYELPTNEDVRLLAALAMAGGRTMQAADKVRLIRQVSGQQEPVVTRLSVREAKANGEANMLLAPGDVVSVEETPITMVVKTVTDVIRIGIGGSVGFF